MSFTKRGQRKPNGYIMLNEDESDIQFNTSSKSHHDVVQDSHCSTRTCERTTIQASLVWKQHHYAFKCGAEWLFTSNPHASAVVQNLNFACFWQKQHGAATKLLNRSHLPLSPRMSPTGQLEVDCQLICRTIDNHLLPLLLHTYMNAHVNKHTYTHTYMHTYLSPHSPCLTSLTKMTGTAMLSRGAVSVLR